MSPADGGGPARRRVVLYTCTFEAYDYVYPPAVVDPFVDYVIFSDRPFFRAGPWQWRPIPEAAAALSQTEQNRYCKFFAGRLFPGHACSIYVDGNIHVRGSLAGAVDAFAASGADIALFRHRTRRSVEEELAACLLLGKITPEEHRLGLVQIARYRAEGLPDDHVLTENGIIFRRHDSATLDHAMALWWSELQQSIRRDQISLPHVLRRTGVPVMLWDWHYRAPNPYFFHYAHKGPRLRNIDDFLRVLSMRPGRWRRLFAAVRSLYATAVFAPYLRLAGRLERRFGRSRPRSQE